jgi:hypothetical protein
MLSALRPESAMARSLGEGGGHALPVRRNDKVVGNHRRSGSISDEGRELAAEIATIEIQMESPKPKWSLMREALQSARRIAESAAGRVLGGGVARELANFDWSTLF